MSAETRSQLGLDQNVDVKELDSASLDLESLPLDKPAKVADLILLNLNLLASKTVILQHSVSEVFKHCSS
jgi:hypothetical protein